MVESFAAGDGLVVLFSDAQSSFGRDDGITSGNACSALDFHLANHHHLFRLSRDQEDVYGFTAYQEQAFGFIKAVTTTNRPACVAGVQGSGKTYPPCVFCRLGFNLADALLFLEPACFLDVDPLSSRTTLLLRRFQPTVAAFAIYFVHPFAFPVKDISGANLVSVLFPTDKLPIFKASRFGVIG